MTENAAVIFCKLDFLAHGCRRFLFGPMNQTVSLGSSGIVFIQTAPSDFLRFLFSFSVCQSFVFSVCQSFCVSCFLHVRVLHALVST